MAGNGGLRIAVLIGAEPYQAHHVADIAFELAQRDGVAVEILALLPETLAEVARLERDQRDREIPRRLLNVPPHLRAMQRLRLLGSLKVQVLRHNRALLSGYDAIVTPTDHARFIRPLLDPLPRMIYVNHGIGGRAASYSDKYLGFDFVLVAGANDERRLLEQRRVRPGRYVVPGYPKFEAARRLADAAPRLFDNDSPVVLFNPHSKRSLRSWEKFARPLIDHAAKTGEFNLIVAPHAKLFGRRPRSEWRKWEALAVPGRLIVDLGGPRSLDMSYAHAADIYAGDVSSQLYEFLTEPKPCVFLNAHGMNWKGNPDFPNWDLGDVADTPEEAIDAIRNARARHPLYAERQRERMDEVVDRSPGAAKRGANAILTFLAEPRRPSVMFCISDLGTGGTARATMLVANGLAENGHDVSLAAMRGGGVLTGQLDSRVKLIELRSSRGRGASMALAAGELANAIRSERPTQLVSAGNHMHLTAALAHRLAGSTAELIVKMTNALERGGGIGARLRRSAYRSLFARADRILLITRSARDALARAFPSLEPRLRVVDNPYITDAMVAAGEAYDRFDKGRLLAMGRLVKQKDYPLLLESLARIRDLAWTLDVLGDGPLLKPLREQAKRLGISERVRFHGFVADPLPFLTKAHALVLSSAWEGQGAVLLEALACGCPVVATRSTDAVGEVLGEGQFGRLVAPGDAQALADAMAAELAERSAITEEAKAWVRRYRIGAGVRSHADALGLD